jgi:hypothetical protein
MITIHIKEYAGIFAENKDIARDIRINTLMPALSSEDAVVIDFSKVDGATQSFVHALISEPLRVYGKNTLNKIQFKNCNGTIQEIITIVTEYMQEAEA